MLNIFALRRFFALMMLLALPASAWAQSPPRPLPQEIIAKSTFTAQELQEIKSYAAYWTAAMTAAGAKAEDVERARGELFRPLTAPAVSYPFRLEYGHTVSPVMEQAIKGENLHLAVNALAVLAQLGTEKALDVLVNHSNPSVESRWQIRLRAAGGCVAVFRMRTPLPPNKVITACKRIRDAAVGESNHLALTQMFAAIDAGEQPTLSPAERQQVRMLLVGAICGVIDEIVKRNINDSPSRLLEAISSGVLAVRAKFISSDTRDADRREIGAEINPRLGKVLHIVNSTWEAARADEEIQRLYNFVVATCEPFMELIEQRLRGQHRTAGELQRAWKAGNKQRFEDGLKSWQEALSQAPYRR